MPRVNPAILVWARETAQLAPEEATRKLQLRPKADVSAVERLHALESGQEQPTRPMLVRMAKQYRRPLVTFYMTAPPRKGDRGEDFRTLPDDYTEADDAFLDVLIRDVRARQSMVRASLEDEGDATALPFIGSMQIEDGADTVRRSIADTLGLDLQDFREQANQDDAFGYLRSRAEGSGIFVLLKGDLGSHHTAIDLNTFRGFVVADNIAPFVVINDRDSHAAWSFTLLHELGHLWLGQTGVSGLSTGRAVERFCNDVAGEFLLPRDELRELDLTAATDFDELGERINHFAGARNVSRGMVAYRLYRANRIDLGTWSRLRDHFYELWLGRRDQLRRRNAERASGPTYYVVRRHRLGKALVQFVRRMIAEGALTTSKGAMVLGVKGKHLGPLLDNR